MIYAFVLLTGIILAFFAFKKFKQSLALIDTGHRATATVTELISKRDSDGDVLYTPVFEFSTIHNQKITYRHSVASRPAGWKVGETTTVVYDPREPEKAKLVTYFGLFSWTIILAAIAAPFIIIGGGYFLAQKYL